MFFFLSHTTSSHKIYKQSIVRDYSFEHGEKSRLLRVTRNITHTASTGFRSVTSRRDSVCQGQRAPVKVQAELDCVKNQKGLKQTVS